ncbi:hypothetical protein QAD02_015576 [Eretmocerus hayati]|uniref:Uncharacterized protein n=1 Tax=Eretmocerus hayati TaxID=131215 RepID=A0ACC2PB25_9HYME|nr:hypothetical protein QAD02_015576 [Eretmocerus hayati]
MKRRDPAKLSRDFTSYLEKHRIFELFQELSSMLLIKKPDDHVLFLKQSIHHAARRLDVPRVVIMAPPGFDRKKLGETLASKLMIPLIRLKDFTDDCEPVRYHVFLVFELTSINSEIFCSQYLSESTFVTEKLRMILMNYMKFNCDGWIFLDFPRNDKEARFLQRSGLIPSHVIDITTEGVNGNSSDGEYFKEIRGLRRVFANLIKRINAKDKEFQDIVDICLAVLKQRMYKNINTELRIVLIDPQNSNRCESLGAHLAEEFGIHHIKFNEVIECVSSQCSELGNNLRAARENSDTDNLSPCLKVLCFKQYLRQPQYERIGWVLTGFPRCVEDLKQLDTTNLRANRVIIVVGKNYGTDEISYIECPDSNADVITGSNHLLLINGNYFQKVCMCEDDIENIIKYTRGSSFIIKEEDKFENLKNKIDFYLAQPPPCVPPREPKPPRLIKPEEIEFDPDDEPSPNIFDNIREPEPTLQLV